MICAVLYLQPGCHPYTSGDMLDVIISANYGVGKLRGFGNMRGQILKSPIEMAGHPYNSAALLHSLR